MPRADEAARSSSATRPSCPSRAASVPGAAPGRSSPPPRARARRAGPGTTARASGTARTRTSWSGSTAARAPARTRAGCRACGRGRGRSAISVGGARAATSTSASASSSLTSCTTAAYHGVVGGLARGPRYARGRDARASSAGCSSAGGLGSAARFALGTLLLERFGVAFPFGTLAVNLIGSALLAALAARLARDRASPVGGSAHRARGRLPRRLHDLLRVQPGDVRVPAGRRVGDRRRLRRGDAWSAVSSRVCSGTARRAG